VQKRSACAGSAALPDEQNRAQGNFRFVLGDFNIRVPTLLFLKAENEVDVEFRIVGQRQP
jgi:hypothetical protein